MLFFISFCYFNFIEDPPENHSLSDGGLLLKYVADQDENVQNVQKMHFLPKSSRCQWVNIKFLSKIILWSSTNVFARSKKMHVGCLKY